MHLQRIIASSLGCSEKQFVFKLFWSSKNGVEGSSHHFFGYRNDNGKHTLILNIDFEPSISERKEWCPWSMEHLPTQFTLHTGLIFKINESRRSPKATNDLLRCNLRNEAISRFFVCNYILLYFACAIQNT